MGWTPGQLMLGAGQTDQARRVPAGARAAAAKIGWADRAQQITDLLTAVSSGNAKKGLYTRHLFWYWGKSIKDKAS